MKKRGLQVLLLAMLVAAAVVLRTRHRLPETPEAAVTALFEAQERGDDEAYLRLVAGDLRESLLHTRAQRGREAFRAGLRDSIAKVKGIAVTEREESTDELAVVMVELVFADRNERQIVHLAPEGGGWVITALSSAERRTPEIPYGTPVYRSK